MRRLPIGLLLIFLAGIAHASTPLQDAQGASPASGARAKSTIVVPIGTSVPLALTRPVMSRTAKAGDSIYAETVFPVAVNNQMAIPAGTYVQGLIDALTLPGIFSPHAHFQIHFTKLIFADGYTVALPGTQGVNIPLQSAASASAATPARARDVLAAVANAYVDVSPASDVLLDNGTQIEMLLQLPLRLDAGQVAESVRRSNPAPIPQFASATRCRPTPGTPGTSDTVIPGTPGTAGTPDIVIPGANGAPDTVIPGIPATSGTPPTVISGSPGTPGTSCPGPPVVTSDSKPQKYKESFQIAAPVVVAGKQLPAGTYEAAWEGMGPSVSVNILLKGKTLFAVPAKVVLLNAKSPTASPAMRANPDGSSTLRSLRFAGQTFALYFSQGPS
jgi:hypothetical protein